MTISEARQFVGMEVALCWHDRNGLELRTQSKIYAADFVPLYGPCLITDAGEVRLDRVISCVLMVQPKIA